MNTTGNISKPAFESRQVIERYCAHVDANVVMSRETIMGKSQNRCLEAHRCDNKDCKHRTGN
ncbi:MAG: hypothetical protein AB9835_13530 [Eubacteriales bacterium]